MKIVIATPILYNAISPFNHLLKDIIDGFLDDGIEIVHLVAVENKAETDLKYGFHGTNIQYKLYKRKNSEHGNIVSRYLRDSITNIREAIGILKLKNADVLFEDVSYSSFWSVLAAKLKGIKVVAMIQDVWPDNAVQSHLISDGSLLYRYFEIWQRYVYKKADRIICISDDMKAFIVSKGVPKNKIEVIYNWGYDDDIVDIAWDDNEFVKKYNLNRDIFYAVYAGNIGKMQNVEIVVNAAKELQDRKDIQFLIIGDGARRKAIESIAAGMKNITMFPMQPTNLATHVYSVANVNIIPLVPNGLNTSLPSKIGVCLSCGKPVIACVNSGSAFQKMVEEYESGFVVSSNSGIELARVVRKLRELNIHQKKYNLFLEKFKIGRAHV